MNTPKTQLSDALAAHRRGDFETAEKGYRAILRAQPNHFDAVQLLGTVLHQRGRNKEALTLLRRAIALNPNLAIVHSNLGSVVNALGQPEESLVHFANATRLDPKFADAFNNRANILYELGRPKEALVDYEKALEINPNLLNALQRSGRILADMGRYEEAVVHNDKALVTGPVSPEIFLRSGNILLHVNKPLAALESYDKALALDPAFKLAIIARGAALEALDRPMEAVENFDRALAAKPNDADYLYNKATVLKSAGLLDEACEAFRKALAVAPHDPDANTKYGMVLLQKGDFAAGWPPYEYRWAQKSNAGKRPRFDFPEWKGENLEGRKILIHAEQGLGDILQFSRYLPMLKAQGADVSFLVIWRMHAILHVAFPDIPLFKRVADAQAQQFDFQCAMMSLPMRFGTQLETIPSAVPYLKADPQKIAAWRERIGTHGFKIGICWQGNPSVSVDVGRSIPLSAFATLADTPGVRLISIQRKDGLDQLKDIGPDMRVETLGDDFDAGDDAFVDTLAVMENLDLIITLDTSVAHVAGALGRPVWVALKHVSDWRWMADRADTPWYPTMRLFRQDAPRNWSGVFSSIREALESLMGEEKLERN